MGLSCSRPSSIQEDVPLLATKRYHACDRQELKKCDIVNLFSMQLLKTRGEAGGGARERFQRRLHMRTVMALYSTGIGDAVKSGNVDLDRLKSTSDVAVLKYGLQVSGLSICSQ